MALLSAKCPECGANIDIDNSRDFCFCNYCGAKIFHEKQRLEVSGTVTVDTTTMTDTMLERALLQLNGGEFQAALSTCDRILDIQPHFAPAYMARFCARHELRHIGDAEYLYDIPTADDQDMIYAVDFAEGETKEQYRKTAEKSQRRYEEYTENARCIQNSLDRAEQLDKTIRIEAQNNSGFIIIGIVITVLTAILWLILQKSWLLIIPVAILAGAIAAYIYWRKKEKKREAEMTACIEEGERFQQRNSEMEKDYLDAVKG